MNRYTDLDAAGRAALRSLTDGLAVLAAGFFGAWLYLYLSTGA